MSTEQAPWWTDHNNLSALWTWMEESDGAPEDGPAYFMGKPWKWQPEWEMMQAEDEARVLANAERVIETLKQMKAERGL